MYIMLLNFAETLEARGQTQIASEIRAMVATAPIEAEQHAYIDVRKDNGINANLSPEWGWV